MNTVPSNETTKPVLTVLRGRALEDERKRQKEKTLEWISGNALVIFRRTWSR